MQRYLSLYFNPTGRVSRGAYWLNAWVILPIAAFAISLILLSIGLSFNELANVALSLIILWSNLALSIKRLHDQDKSAWWILFALIPLLGFVVLFIILGFLPGTKGPNRYGPQPHWFN